jgi:hypothetical protein
VFHLQSMPSLDASLFSSPLNIRVEEPAHDNNSCEGYRDADVYSRLIHIVLTEASILYKVG